MSGQKRREAEPGPLQQYKQLISWLSNWDGHRHARVFRRIWTSVKIKTRLWGERVLTVLCRFLELAEVWRVPWFSQSWHHGINRSKGNLMLNTEHRGIQPYLIDIFRGKRNIWPLHRHFVPPPHQTTDAGQSNQKLPNLATRQTQSQAVFQLLCWNFCEHNV